MVMLFYMMNPEIRREKVPFWKAISPLLTNGTDIILLEKEILEIFQVSDCNIQFFYLKIN